MLTGEDLRFPIGKEEDQEEHRAPFDEELKVQLITHIQMLPTNLEFAIQNLDATQLATPYREVGGLFSN